MAGADAEAPGSADGAAVKGADLLRSVDKKTNGAVPSAMPHAKPPKSAFHVGAGGTAPVTSCEVSELWPMGMEGASEKSV